MSEGIESVYDSYKNGEKEREFCRPSRVHQIHDGYNRKKQAVKMANIFGTEKVWGSAYENNRQHGDFRSKKGKHYSRQWDRIFYSLLSEMRNEALDAEVVAGA